MSSKQTIVLITGANQGIGFATATELAKTHGYHVIIGARDAAKGAKAASGLVADGYAASSVQLDVTSDESIAAAVSWIEQKFGRLDVLINNAGILLDVNPDISSNTRELYTQTMNTNVIGVVCLTDACLPLLRKAEFPRLVFVSSRMGSLSVALDKSTPWYSTDYKAYDASKAALNMLALNYVRILGNRDALVNIACPGLVKSNLTRYSEYGSTTEEGAIRIVQLATAKKGSPTATFSDRNGEIPW